MSRATRPSSPWRRLGAGLLGLGLASTPDALAGGHQQAPKRDSTPDSGVYAPASLARQSESFFWPAVALERGVGQWDGASALDETRIGLAMAYRWPWISPHLKLLVSPNIDAYQNVSAAAGLGVRAHLDRLGMPLSLGAGSHVETRLRHSIWLTDLTPLEVGVPLFEQGSAEHYVFVGIRYAVMGKLINSYLVDPNGFDNEISEGTLDAMLSSPWQLYIAFVFGREIR